MTGKWGGKGIKEEIFFRVRLTCVRGICSWCSLELEVRNSFRSAAWGEMKFVPFVMFLKLG